MTAASSAGAVFAWMWAAAMIFDLGKWGRWAVSPVEFALLLATLGVLLRPGSLLRFAALLVLCLAATADKLPWISNHEVVMAFLAATVLAALVLERPAAAQGAQAWFDAAMERAAPLLRAEVIAVYALAAFHKLNFDWFDPAVSCGVVLYERLRDLSGFLPDTPAAEQVAIALGIGTEFALALLLWRPRLRIAGVVIGSLFHLVLGLAGFFRFSALMYAAYAVFLPRPLLERMVRTVTALARRAGWTAELQARLEPLERRLPVLGVGLFIMAVAFVAWPEADDVLRLPGEIGAKMTAMPFLGQVTFFAWILWSAGLLGLLAFALGSSWPEPRPSAAVTPRLRSASLGTKALWILPVLLVANGLAPYLGLKTDTSFAMFSNLRTAGDATNHLLVRHRLLAETAAGSVVRIVASSDEGLARMAREELGIPAAHLALYLEARRAEGAAPSLDYVWRGRPGHLGGDDPRPLPFPRPSGATGKLAWWRPVDLRESSRCLH
jgi:hypothetical protein